MPVSPPPSPSLFLVDGYALIYRAFYAFIARPLTTSRGENTSAAFGVVQFLNLLMKNHHPAYLGWVHDSGTSFRHETFPEYKATREKLSEDLQQDFDRGMQRIGELLDAYRIPVLTVPGYEADDVIGTLVRQAVERNTNVVVVSADKDFQQLVRPGVWILNPGRGGPANVQEHWVSTENASERLGVPPALVTDFLALVGDTSDNIPGVRGIGDKTAVELVNSYGTVEQILAHAPEITKKRPREALLAQADAARLSKELVTIREDVDITLDLESLRRREPDNLRLRDLLVELEFHTLARQIDVPAPAEAPLRPKPGEGASKYVTVTRLEDVAKVIEKARQAPYIAMNVQTVADQGAPNDPMRSSIVGVSIAIAPGEAYYFPMAHRRYETPQASFELTSEEAAPARKSKAKTAEPVSIAARALAAGVPDIANLPSLDAPEMRPLRDLLEDPEVRKTAQNGKVDRLVLRRAGIQLRGLDFDTMIASYVLDPGRRSHGLDVLALEFLQTKVSTYEDLCGKGRALIPYDQVPVSCATNYAAENADVVLRLRQEFEPQLEAMAARRLFDDIEMPLLPVLAEMEWKGVMIDVEGFAQLKRRFESERHRLEGAVHEAAGQQFNINSPLQLREILFEKLKLPVLKKTPSGPSTDASVLQQLADAGHELPVLLMDYREVTKLESTYIDALPVLLNPETGRLHTSFNQTVAATGRLSSENPNLQNIPIRSELGRDIRRLFIAKPGAQLLSADYSQIELRLLAHLSGDEAFVQAFRTGGDIHRQTAALIFDVSVDDVTSEMRARAKTINFATIYGQGPHALSQQLKITHAEARAFIDRYFERLPGVRRYLDSSVAFAREHGYVQTIFGRRRYTPELRDRNFNIRAFGERVAANSPIQGSAADLIKIAMVRVANALRTRQLASAMLLQVHDELVFEAPTNEVETLSELVRTEMEGAAELAVPLVVDIGVGPNWLDTKLG
ncbi:MAG TPA: DNA polymerase I [Gemmatimonadaceae bacterium]|nr:DNA polymerase I [Gemmatimonadaceae bacterium]